MNELSETQIRIMELLKEKNVSRSDILSIMLVLTKDEKAKEFLRFISENESVLPDEIIETAGRIAFGDEK